MTGSQAAEPSAAENGFDWYAKLAHDPPMTATQRPVALVTGVGRQVGIGAAITERLARDGWDVGFTYWQPYDDKFSWGRDADSTGVLRERCGEVGARTVAVEADLIETGAAEQIFDGVNRELGPVRALIMSHCESVDSGLLDTSVESFDRHFAVNARASWLLIREFANRYTEPHGAGRIVALTSDAVVGNVPYGASKGALDRITIAAARELAHLGITANAVNPGPVDTGWLAPSDAAALAQATPLGRLGTTTDTANLISFLCGPEGGWVNGQLLHSNGGLN